MDGINTKKLVMNPDEAEHVKLMFDMYAQPNNKRYHFFKSTQT